VKGSRDLLFKFWDPLYISGTVEARNFQIWHADWPLAVLSKTCKLCQKGSWRCHMTYFVILGPPPYLGNWLKLETSNLACRLATGDLNKIIQNYV